MTNKTPKFKAGDLIAQTDGAIAEILEVKEKTYDIRVIRSIKRPRDNGKIVWREHLLDDYCELLTEDKKAELV